MLTTIFKDYAPFCGELSSRENGSLTASAQGQVTSYALDSAQNRGRMMVTPGDEVYENQVRPCLDLKEGKELNFKFKSIIKCTHPWQPMRLNGWIGLSIVPHHSTHQTGQYIASP